MKKLCTVLMLCLVSIMTQGEQKYKLTPIGVLENCGIQTSICVTTPKENGYFDISFIGHDTTFFFVAGKENIELFRENLLSIRNKYIEWKKEALNNNMQDTKKTFPFYLPISVAWWSKNSNKMEIVKNHVFTPIFVVEKENEDFAMFIIEQVVSSNNETKLVVWGICSEEDFDTLLFYTEIENVKKALQNKNFLK